MKQANLILPGLILLVTASCLENEVDCLAGKGGVVSREFNISSFSEFSIFVAADVEVKPDKFTSVIVEGQENILDALKVIGTNGKLVIGEGNCFRNEERLKIYITTPSVEVVELAGSGSVTGVGIFDVPRFEADITGSGNIHFEMNAEEFSGTISGSGNMELGGMASKLALYGVGSGNFNCFDLSGTNAEISLTGSGNAEVNVSDHLDAAITGSGNVFYKGNPTVDVNITGTGELVKVD